MQFLCNPVLVPDQCTGGRVGRTRCTGGGRRQNPSDRREKRREEENHPWSARSKAMAKARETRDPSLGPEGPGERGTSTPRK